jgi:hypothetical protein
MGHNHRKKSAHGPADDRESSQMESMKTEH